MPEKKQAKNILNSRMKPDKKQANSKQQYRINEQIRVREVRIVDEDGSSVMPTRQALDIARQKGVDLVEISPNAQPPVCRIIDYSKFLYQQKKRAKEMKQKQVKVEVKEIRFGPQTDDHDYQFKLMPRNSSRKATRFVPMYSSVDVPFSSRNRVRFSFSVSQTTLRSVVR